MIEAKEKYKTLYNEIAEETNLPLSFIIAHAQIESNQNHLATGKLGEYGLWQFLPSTWKTLMGNADWKSIENQKNAYIKHIKWILKKYQINPVSILELPILLWIWNAGPGNYEKNIMPKVTEKYIKNVMKYVI